MRFAIATLASLTLATKAAALSCMPADIASAYKDAAAAEESYVIALGRFDFDQDQLPIRAVDNDNPPSTTVMARFVGSLFTGRDFGFETELDVTLDAQCFGPWCGAVTAGDAYLAFLEEREGGYHLTVGPCPGRLFSGPGKPEIEQVIACYAGNECVSARE